METVNLSDSRRAFGNLWWHRRYVPITPNPTPILSLQIQEHHSSDAPYGWLSGQGYSNRGLVDSAAKSHNRYSNPVGQVELADGTYAWFCGHFDCRISVPDSAGTRRNLELTSMVMNLSSGTSTSLGWDWLEAVNPQIDWPKRTGSTR